MKNTQQKTNPAKPGIVQFPFFPFIFSFFLVSSLVLHSAFVGLLISYFLEM